MGVINIDNSVEVDRRKPWERLHLGGSKQKNQSGRKKENQNNAMSSSQEWRKFQESDGKLVLNIAREVKRVLRTGGLIWQLGSH